MKRVDSASRKAVTTMIPTMECGDVNEEVCREEKRTRCSQVMDKISKEVPEEICSTQSIEKCRDVPKQETKMITSKRCKTVSEPVCRDI